MTEKHHRRLSVKKLKKIVISLAAAVLTVIALIYLYFALTAVQ